MLASCLALSLLAPQGGASRVHLPSKDLPDERTLFVLELPDPQALAAHADRLAQLAVLRIPRVREILDRALARSGVREPEVREQALREMAKGFDRGLTVAAVFSRETLRERQPPSLRFCVLGSASKASTVRDHPKLLRTIVASENLVTERRALADTPVVVEWLHRQKGWKVDWSAKLPQSVDNWRFVSDSSVFAAFKGRTQAFVFQTGFMDWLTPIDAVSVLGDALGLRARPGVRLPAIAESKPEGWTTLLRAHYRPRTIRTMLAKQGEGRPVAGPIWAAILGVHVIDDATAVIATDGSNVEERVRIDLVPNKPTLFSALRTGSGGLLDVARYLPKGTIAAAHVRLDGKLVSDRFWDLVDTPGSAILEPDRWMTVTRTLLGLAAYGNAEKPARAGWDGLRELTVALVPGAAGSLLPEPVLLAACERAAEPKALLQRFAELLAEASPEVDVAHAGEKLRTLGKGDDAVHYLRFSDFVQDAPDTRLMRLFGGGFLSAVQVGDRLAVGCNPRTLRKLLRTTREDSLQSTTGFAERFPADQDVACEVLFDPARLVGENKSLLGLVRYVRVFAPRAHIPELPPLDDLMPLLRTESFRLRRTQTGWLLVHRGGTLLSPAAWLGCGLAVRCVATLVGLMTGK